MTALSPLFMDIDSVYSGDELGLPYRDIMGEGIVNSGDLLVSERASGGANLSVDVAAGSCWIIGDDDAVAQPTYRCRQTGVHNLTITPDASNPLIVRVVAEIIDAGFAGASRLWRVRAVHGTAAGSPSTPALPSNAISLATVAVSAAAASIVDANITDTRTRARVGSGSALSGGTIYGSTLASASAVAVVSGYTYLLTGTTSINTMTGGVSGGVVTLVASGQATGVCVILNHATGTNNLDLRDDANFGLYAGESLTLMFDGTKWVEVSRNVKTVLDYQQITGDVNITGTAEATATAAITMSAITFDGATPIRIDIWCKKIKRGTGWIVPVLYDGTSVGLFNVSGDFPITGDFETAKAYVRRLTPTNAAHTYTFRCYVDSGTGVVYAGAGGVGAQMPSHMTISRDL